MYAAISLKQLDLLFSAVLVSCANCGKLLPAVNEGLASFVEYKCISAAFPEMSGAGLFQRASAPHGAQSRKP